MEKHFGMVLDKWLYVWAHESTAEEGLWKCNVLYTIWCIVRVGTIPVDLNIEHSRKTEGWERQRKGDERHMGGCLLQCSESFFQSSGLSHSESKARQKHPRNTGKINLIWILRYITCPQGHIIGMGKQTISQTFIHPQCEAVSCSFQYTTAAQKKKATQPRGRIQVHFPPTYAHCGPTH